MNNPGIFLNQLQAFQNYEQNQIDYNKLLGKIERLEKNVRILENRLNKLENKSNKKIIEDEPTDMYML